MTEQARSLVDVQNGLDVFSGELLEKEQELENTSVILKSEIDEKSYQLELFENQLKRLKEAISEIK